MSLISERRVNSCVEIEYVASAAVCPQGGVEAHELTIVESDITAFDEPNNLRI